MKISQIVFSYHPKIYHPLMNPHIEKLHSLMKLNKDKNPIRTVVSLITAPCARHRRLILKLNSEIEYTELINRIKYINLTESCKYISFRVKNSFSSILNWKQKFDRWSVSMKTISIPSRKMIFELPRTKLFSVLQWLFLFMVCPCPLLSEILWITQKQN